MGLIGEELEDYAYTEYLRSDGVWQGGYSARVNINTDGTTQAQWMELWEQENNCPW